MNYFAEFKQIVKKFKINIKEDFINSYVQKGLNEEYNKWVIDVSTKLQEMDSAELCEQRKAAKLAYEGYKARYENIAARKQNFLSISFAILIALIIYAVEYMTSDLAATLTLSAILTITLIVLGKILIIGIIAVAVMIFWNIFAYSKYKNDYVLFLYYFALLDIMDGLENTNVTESVINNTATVVNSSITKESIKNKHKKNRKVSGNNTIQ